MKINESQKKLLETKVISLATVNMDNAPNVIPIAEAKVVNLDKIIITDNFMKQTASNLKQNPSVCLAVWSDDGKEGYKFIGEAEYQMEGKWLDFVKNMKENEGLAAKAAIMVKISKIIKLC